MSITSNPIKNINDFQAVKKHFEDEVSTNSYSVKQEEQFERSKLAKATDYLAAIPFIGSLFGLARVIASVGVEIYYTRQKSDQSSMMCLRARDECQRGFMEVLPFVGLLFFFRTLLSTSSTLFKGGEGAVGNYYYWDKEHKELYYSVDTLKGKNIQWIQGANIPHCKFIRKTEYSGLAGVWTTHDTCTYHLEDQARVIPADGNPEKLELSVRVVSERENVVPIDKLV